MTPYKALDEKDPPTLHELGEGITVDALENT